jgi:hypothetical protein
MAILQTLTSAVTTGFNPTCIRHALVLRRQARGALAGAILLLTLAACTTLPQNIVAAAPATASSDCIAVQPATAAQATPQQVLTDSIDRVRHWPYFRTPDIAPDSDFVDPKNAKPLVTEAVRLVKIAQAKAAKNVLIDNLPPWVGQKNVLWQDITSDVKGLTDNAFSVIRPIINQKLDGQRNALISSQANGTAAVAVSQPSAGNVIFTAIEDLYHDVFFRNLATLASYRAFHQLTLLSAAHIKLMLDQHPNPDTTQLDQLDTEVRIFNYGRFVSTYFDAYFRGGQFIQFNVNEQDLLTALQTDLPSKIQAGLKAGDVPTYLQTEMTKLCTGLCNTKLGQTALVTRAGLTVQFSGISYTVTTSKGIGLSHTYPQMTQVGPQLIRVLVEALFDANGLIPKGAPTSTACVEGLLSQDTDCLQTTDPEDLQTKIQQIDMYATTMETITSSVTGIVIRNTGAINNEAIAQTIETLFGVVSRKILEKALYTASGGAEVKDACPVKPIPVAVQ